VAIGAQQNALARLGEKLVERPDVTTHRESKGLVAWIQMVEMKRPDALVVSA
jgi:hypothetical protein